MGWCTCVKCCEVCLSVSKEAFCPVLSAKDTSADKGSATVVMDRDWFLQLFRERLSEKVHATIPKGIVGGFEFTVLQRNLKELARKAMEMCLRVLTESDKSRFDSYSRQEQCIDHIPHYLSGLSRAHFSRQPFSK